MIYSSDLDRDGETAEEVGRFAAGGLLNLRPSLAAFNPVAYLLRPINIPVNRRVGEILLLSTARPSLFFTG